MFNLKNINDKIKEKIKLLKKLTKIEIKNPSCENTKNRLKINN